MNLDIQTLSILFLGVAGVMAILLLLVIVLMASHFGLKKKYRIFMTGADGKNLESSLLVRLKEVDVLKQQNKQMQESIQGILENLKTVYQKWAMVKYDAFKEMGGKLSFSLCMLNGEENGFIITSMHSSREGCYTYIKEIIKGEAFVILSEEEKTALTEAKAAKEPIKKKG